ncbi:YggS family pyridoxal phosphate-dependent enzyme [Mycetocola spongiae]|uniref:YggS family pyridoxal phosphate-dependent enzyme n=1 Tax=Mycetocola spongiae TaxID=2859226 RepID=UPI001CF59487|nr:YggS family pyridoxal phosphate-dependent enzyme [Mycetocola spongiae]UCR89778.1 YggS family pyridoxal phosphate-dependent enzyme [Mycetocola spongiae]
MALSVEPGGENHDLAAGLARINAGVADAARAAHRDPAEITTIVVTKFHPASLVRDLYALGVRDVGENRHQEARAKAEETSDLEGLRWNFIGQLQSKKARQVRRYAAAVHSLDRESVIAALADPDPDYPEAAPLPGFLQINLTDDPGRGGVNPAEVEAAATRVLESAALDLRGVMAVAPLDEEPRVAFARLREISERVRRLKPEARFISAGMSHDYAAAIAEGATHLRIGSAITGKRPEQR